MRDFKVKPRFWIIVSLVLLVVCTVSEILAVLSPNWLEVVCANGTIYLGLWQYCGRPIELLDPNGIHYDKTILDLFGYKHETEACLSVENHFIVSNGKTVWFYANRSLQCVALAASVLTMVLFSLYSFAPRAFVMDHTRGFVFLNLTLASFISVGLFIVAGNDDSALTIVPEDYQCSSTDTTVSDCVYLAACAATSCCTAGAILGVIWMLERSKRGDGSIYTGTTRMGAKTNMVLPSITSDLASRSDVSRNASTSNRYNRLMATCSFNPGFPIFKPVSAEPSSSTMVGKVIRLDNQTDKELTEINTEHNNNFEGDTGIDSTTL